MGSGPSEPCLNVLSKKATLRPINPLTLLPTSCSPPPMKLR